MGDAGLSADPTYEELRSAPLNDVRAAIRSNAYDGHTAGLAFGRLQANIVILPEVYALDFMRFCQRNPKPCPLVGVSETGDPMMRTLGADLDIRTDAPSYNIYEHGRLAGAAPDLKELWRSDFVAFALGCSFTFERALVEAGVGVRHIERNTTVPMFETSLPNRAAGVFGGQMVVSMRPIRNDQLDAAAQISARYPYAHGGPVHIGAPEAIGVSQLDRPDWGDPCEIRDAETPVFWACGVTPQAAIRQAEIPLCVTHTPGRMLITDVDEMAETPVL